MDEDRELIKRYLHGNVDAMEMLAMRYQKQVYSLIYRMTSDAEETKDLTQDVFLKVIHGIKNFRNEASFKTWLYRIAVNTGINYTMQKRNGEIELNESACESISDTVSEIIDKEKKDYLKNALTRLTPRERLAIILRVYENLSCRETADVMQCSESAMKTHYHNGVQRLKEILRSEGYESKP